MTGIAWPRVGRRIARTTNEYVLLRQKTDVRRFKTQERAKSRCKRETITTFDGMNDILHSHPAREPCYHRLWAMLAADLNDNSIWREESSGVSRYSTGFPVISSINAVTFGERRYSGWLWLSESDVPDAVRIAYGITRDFFRHPSRRQRHVASTRSASFPTTTTSTASICNPLSSCSKQSSPTPCFSKSS